MAAEDSNKVVLVGDFAVGKTTIFTRFKTGRAEGGSLNTRKECECSKTLHVDGKDMAVSVVDGWGDVLG
jgi:GTPase SAR1 family protein